METNLSRKQQTQVYVMGTPTLNGVATNALEIRKRAVVHICSNAQTSKEAMALPP